MLDLKQIECFFAVAEELHFGRAAQRLHLSQPAVSLAVRKLELSVGGPLFLRTSRQVRLTPLGEAFAAHMRPAYEELLAAYERSRSLAATLSTRVAIGYTREALGLLLRALPEVKRREPKAVITLHVMRTNEQVERLQRGTLDLGICWQPDVHEDLESIGLGAASLVVIAAANHPLAQRSSVRLEELVGLPLIGWPRNLNAALYDRFACLMRHHDADWAFTAEHDEIETVAVQVLMGRGLGVVASMAVHGLEATELVRIPISDGPTVQRSLVWRRDGLTRTAGSMVKLLRELCHEQNLLGV
jgi:DNA-binding transcriptional LysR family regulator